MSPDRVGETTPTAPPSGLRRALDVLGDRWSPLVVAALLDGPARFGELGPRLPGIAPNILSQRLRALEAAGVIVAAPYSERPPRFVYELTGAGRELADALRLLGDWGARYGEGREGDPLRHAACGTPLEVRWYCPLCDDTVGPGGGEEQLFHA